MADWTKVLKEPTSGTNVVSKDRTVDENLKLFKRCKKKPNPNLQAVGKAYCG